MSLRGRLMIVFVLATLAPLAITVSISIELLQRSFSLGPTRDLDDISKSLQQAGHALYVQAGESLKNDAAAGRVSARQYSASSRAAWPAFVREFAAGPDAELITLGGNTGNEMHYLARHGSDVWVYSRQLDGVDMARMQEQYAHARAWIETAHGGNLRRGYIYTLLSLSAGIWIVALFVLVYWAHRISGPIRRLTDGLAAVASGKLEHRVEWSREDETGHAIAAFNHMTQQLEESRDRLVYTTRLESWQALARKMAHEVKNSLTPIRLTMEEMAARFCGRENEFVQQASQIVVDEVTALERRVRAFADFSSEPAVRPKELDLNAMLQERISFLKTAHPEVVYSVRLSEESPRAVADEDLLKGMLTNLLENAAQAARPGGVVLGKTAAVSGKAAIEVHDSGPGLSALARRSLFEPTISFKPGGMGLGLSIARRSAVLLGGDIELVAGELGGAGFRILLPLAAHSAREACAS